VKNSAWYLAPVIVLIAGLSLARGQMVETDVSRAHGGFGQSRRRRSRCRSQRHLRYLLPPQQHTHRQASYPPRRPPPWPCLRRVFCSRHRSAGQSPPSRSKSRRYRGVRKQPQLPPRPGTSDGPPPVALRGKSTKMWPVALRVGKSPSAGTTIMWLRWSPRDRMPAPSWLAVSRFGPAHRWLTLRSPRARQRLCQSTAMCTKRIVSLWSIRILGS
jgi:hypothetical protein